MLKLTAASIGWYYKAIAVDVVNETLSGALEYARAISPTDTSEYINSHTKVDAQVSWEIVKGSIRNDSEHANIVEDGVLWRSYNYHKWPPRNASTVIYTWVGNRTYQRTLDIIKPVLETKLTNAKR